MSEDADLIEVSGSLGSILKVLLVETLTRPTRSTVLTSADRQISDGETHSDSEPQELAPKSANQKAPRRRGVPPPHPPVVLSSHFKLIFLTVVGITVVAGLLHVCLAGVWIAPTNNQQSAFESMGLAWKLGLGAILGLVGGKIV